MSEQAPLGKELISTTEQLETKCGSLYTHFIYKHNKPGVLESIQANLGKSGTCPRAHLSSYCDFIVHAINNMQRQQVVEALNKATGHRCGEGSTCIDVLLRLIMEKVLNGEVKTGG